MWLCFLRRCRSAADFFYTAFPRCHINRGFLQYFIHSVAFVLSQKSCVVYSTSHKTSSLFWIQQYYMKNPEAVFQARSLQNSDTQFHYPLKMCCVPPHCLRTSYHLCQKLPRTIPHFF